MNDIDGTPFAFASFLGQRAALIEFWATWCPLCEALLPQIRTAAATYGGDLEIIGMNVTVNQSKGRVQRYVDEHKPPFRVLWDERGAAVRAYDAPGTSYVVIIDREGKVAYTGIGNDQDLTAALRRVMGR